MLCISRIIIFIHHTFQFVPPFFPFFTVFVPLFLSPSRTLLGRIKCSDAWSRGLEWFSLRPCTDLDVHRTIPAHTFTISPPRRDIPWAREGSSGCVGTKDHVNCTLPSLPFSLSLSHFFSRLRSFCLDWNWKSFTFHHLHTLLCNVQRDERGWEVVWGMQFKSVATRANDTLPPPILSHRAFLDPVLNTPLYQRQTDTQNFRATPRLHFKPGPRKFYKYFLIFFFSSFRSIWSTILIFYAGI